MLRQNRGAILNLNVASMAAVHHAASSAEYAASKSGAVARSRPMWNRRPDKGAAGAEWRDRVAAASGISDSPRIIKRRAHTLACTAWSTHRRPSFRAVTQRRLESRAVARSQPLCYLRFLAGLGLGSFREAAERCSPFDNNTAALTELATASPVASHNTRR
jgi:hypothetical protein